MIVDSCFFDCQDMDLDLPSPNQELDSDFPILGKKLELRLVQHLHKTEKSKMCYGHSSESVLVPRHAIRISQYLYPLGVKFGLFWKLSLIWTAGKQRNFRSVSRNFSSQ